jgi:hypothetical protein
MFMGFQNVVSGTFLRQTSKRKIAADYKTHTENEQFCVRHHPSCGYLILAKNGDGFLPLRIGPGTELEVCPHRDQGTIFKFTHVENDD